MPQDRQMMLVAFMQAQNCAIYTGSWRHPASAPDFMTADYWQRIGRVLEEGKFHMAFFDDRLAMPDIYGANYETAVEGGTRCVKLDPITVLTTIAMATSKLGLGATYSTTYYEPFHVARLFATLDHMSGGRAAWNVVTSLNDSEAANFGASEHLAHDLRYDRADEFLEVVQGHWNSWGDGAIKADKESGRFADASLVKRLDYAGKYFKSRGPFTVPRTPQGEPVIIQAGQSGRGKAFAARWGEVIFASAKSVEQGQVVCRDIKDEVARQGRDPNSVKIAGACYAIVGETREIAREKVAMIDTLADPYDALALLSEITNFDFAKRKMDEPFTDADLNAMTGQQSLKERVIKFSGKSNPTPREFAMHSKRGTIYEHPVFQGTPKDVADQMEEWFVKEACDGFVLTPTHRPGGYEDFVRLVVPELQRRGLHQKEYRGTTLRENLGLGHQPSKFTKA